VNVIPLTSRKSGRRIYPNEAVLPSSTAGLSVESIALCYQIRTLDKRRLKHRFGMIEADDLRQAIVEALRFQLAL
jgi:mRNA interferase MazF